MNTGSSPSDVAWLSMSLLLIDLDILTTSEGVVMEPLILLLIGSDSTNCMLHNTNSPRAAGMIGVFILIANSYDNQCYKMLGCYCNYCGAFYSHKLIQSLL